MGVRYTGAAYVVSGLASLGVLAFDLLFGGWEEGDLDRPWLRTSRTVIVSSSSGLIVVVGILNFYGALHRSPSVLSLSVYLNFLLIFLAGVSTILLFASIFRAPRDDQTRGVLLMGEGAFRTAALLLLPVSTGPYVYSLMWRLKYRSFLPPPSSSAAATSERESGLRTVAADSFAGPLTSVE